MQLSQKQIVIGMVLMALLAYGSGYGIAKRGMNSLQDRLESAATKNSASETKIQVMKNQAEVLSKELMALKEQGELSPAPEPYVLDTIRRHGIEPAELLENLKENPSQIPEPAVLGGTMAFTQLRILNDRWVYGAYEDGHIAGAAVFQWEIRGSSVEWTPVLVMRE